MVGRAMEISAQAIQTVGGQSGPLQSFVAALKPGDSLAAQVLARTPEGLAVLALAGRQVQLPLPQQLLPGTILTLTVQQGSNGLQFSIQPQAGQPGAAPQPAQTSQLAPQPGAQPAPQSPANPAAAATVRATTPPPANTPLPPLVNARTGLPVPAMPSATPGQAVMARVLATPTPTTAIISVGNQELPVTLPTPSTPGAQLALVVQRGPDGLQLAHAPARGVPLAVPSTPTAPQLAGTAPTATPTPAAPQTQPTSVPGLVAPATPAAALTQATLAALGNQNSVAALLTSVLRLGDKTRDLPDEVQRALGRLSQAVLSLNGKGPDAAALQRAISRSGVFLESQLAAGSGGPQIQGDLKALLLNVQRALGNWLGADAQSGVVSGKQPPPPQPGAMPRAAMPPAGPGFADDASPETIGKTLLSQTDAALSRLRLHQMASLPDRPDAIGARHDIRMEIPVTIGQQPGVLSLVITPDEDNQDPEKKKKKNWRVQFAVNASVIGEVGAEVGLLGERANVVLSAAEPETAEALDADIAELSEAFEAVGLTPGALRVRRIGAPPPKSGFDHTENASGKLLDRDT